MSAPSLRPFTLAPSSQKSSAVLPSSDWPFPVTALGRRRSGVRQRQDGPRSPAVHCGSKKKRRQQLGDPSRMPCQEEHPTCYSLNIYTPLKSLCCPAEGAASRRDKSSYSSQEFVIIFLQTSLPLPRVGKAVVSPVCLQILVFTLEMGPT